MKLRLRS